MAARPAWQTDELDEEWVEPDSTFDDEDPAKDITSSSVSLTAPIPSSFATNRDKSNSPSTSFHAGTFLIREDVNPVPLLPKTPGRGRTKSAIKDFFSPLPLERMFEPPSPPIVKPSALRASELQPPPSSLLQHTIPSKSTTEDIQDNRPVLGRSDPASAKFTFSMPRAAFGIESDGGGINLPQAQSTPDPAGGLHRGAPNTDPRLRLFQFQYDTFTRDHLSAMVDSIAVNTPSVGSAFGSSAAGTPFNLARGLSRVMETNDASSHFRSAKRVKLSPRSDYYGEGDGAGAVIGRPKVMGKDYVGESQNLMAQIKQARDFSTVSTVPSTSTPHISRISNLDGGDEIISEEALKANVQADHRLLGVPPAPSCDSGSTPRSTHSSSILQQAATLMAQIKHDMNGHRRVFSGDTDCTHTTSRIDDKHMNPSSTHTSIIIHPATDDRLPSNQRRTSVSRTDSGKPLQSTRTATDTSYQEILDDVSKLDLDGHPPTQENVQGIFRAVRLESETIRRVSPKLGFNLTAIASTATQQASSGQRLPPPPSTDPPPARAGATEDLNRFVSSSTASSGTTVTSGSVPSFVKHAGGPIHAAHAQMRRIGPGDIPPLPDRVGNMVLDPVMMKWVKSSVAERRDSNTALDADASDDPFRDIESLREDSPPRQPISRLRSPIEVPLVVENSQMSRIEEQTEIEEDAEEVQLNSFSFDNRLSGVVEVMTGVESEDPQHEDPSDSEDDEQDMRILENTATDFATSAFGSSEDSFSDDTEPGMEIPAVVIDQYSTPSRPSLPPFIRPALKSTTATPLVQHRSRVEYYATPAPKKNHRRSVSFSDGKHDGQIRGLGRNGSGSVSTDNSTISSEVEQSQILLPSARSKRIADMMEALEHSEPEDSSPSKVRSAATASRKEQNARRVSSSSSLESGHTSRRVFSRSRTRRTPPRRHVTVTEPNATFLTECSFAVTHDRLVQIITDVQPFEPYWEDLSCIDLSSKNVESVARLKEFLPRLDSLTLNSNQLCWLSGVPSTVRTLSVSSNCLTGLTSFGHLLNLEHLDISNNDVDSLLQLSCLRRLKELRADSNKIGSMDGLQKMDALVKLSLEGNCISGVNLEEYRLTRLEMLNLSKNRLGKFIGVARLPCLIALNVDDNALGELDVTALMGKMRILRISGNKLRSVDVGFLPNLRTLYADNNSLVTLANVDQLTKLENLSVRNQSGKGLTVLTRDVRDVRRLYYSGNAMKSGFLREPCYNLVYLELAACRLTRLPDDLANLVPNLRVFNLNYNFLEDARCLAGLSRLKKLSIIGSRLKGTRSLVKVLCSMPDVEMLDFRMNPCTLGWYLPLLVKDIPGALQPSEGNGEDKKRENRAWQELDAKFRRDLPDDAYIGRLAYRGLVMGACPRIRMLDGVEVTEKERAKAQRLLLGIQEKKGRGG